MSGWTRHMGKAVAYPLDAIDTDQIIPARFMSTPRSEGYGSFLFHDLRDDTFVLTRHPDASILIGGQNFGSGSSREAAVYALVDFGIRAVIAPSFGDIFASNAVNNGLLPARVDEDACTALAEVLGDGGSEATIDLATTTLTFGDQTIPFALDPVWREKLINGWDDIDLTRQHIDTIAAYRETLGTKEPWRFPAQAG